MLESNGYKDKHVPKFPGLIAQVCNQLALYISYFISALNIAFNLSGSLEIIKLSESPVPNLGQAVKRRLLKCKRKSRKEQKIESQNFRASRVNRDFNFKMI